MALKVTGEQLIKEWEEAGKKMAEAQEHYHKIDDLLKRYTVETGKNLVHCDKCGKLMFENPSEDFGKGNFLHWNFCSDACREVYWRGAPAPEASR
ncbi:MAG: hypothetical protein NTY90_02875 [Candidatus Micrarchaeota archaeon]|nr:hypothetical protein [Candidatus Micrarchaeota archaeon]